MKKLILLFLLITLVGCSPTPPQQTLKTSNPEFTVHMIGKVDGCTIYRFEDAGRSHYFVRCIEGSVHAMGIQGCGKNCTYADEIPTTVVKP